MPRRMRGKAVLGVALVLVAGCGAQVGSDGSDDDEAALTACTDGETSRYRVESGRFVGPPFVGYGAEYNQNLYARNTVAAGVTAANVGALEDKVISLASEHVRVFFDSRALTDADLMQSFVKTVELAQRSGATINITYWHGPYPAPAYQMDRFGDVLVELVRNKGLGAVRYVTIQNEVNSTRISLPLYASLWRALDSKLRAAGLRSHFDFVGGDLLEENQGEWIRYMAAHLSDVLDGYSVHIYWDYRDTAKLVSRLSEVRALVNGLPSGRKPLYVTEFGVRGDRSAGAPDPGDLASGTPVEQSTTAALQPGWFELMAARLGYVATVKWDAYFALYDSNPQYYSLIGKPGGGFALRPGYYLLRMLTHVVTPGARAVDVAGNGAGKVVTAFEHDGETTVLAANLTRCRQSLAISGLPKGRELYFVVWNGDGGGKLAAHPRVQTGADGAVTVSAPPRSVVSLSTEVPGLGL